MDQPEGKPVHPSRILIIDNDPHILSQVRRILEKNGYEAQTATSGRAGLNLFQQDPPDLILLNFELTDTSGLDLMAQMKGHRPYVPVMILAAASEVAAVASLRRGADDYVTKPISPEELLERVRHNLEKGRQARIQAELNEQLQRQLGALVSVREVAREASQAADLYYLLQRALRQTLRTMQLDAGILFVSENSDLIPLAHHGLPRTIASALTRRRLSWHDAALRAFQRVTQAARTHREMQQGGPLSLSTEYAFTAVVPLWTQGQCWGILEVAGRTERTTLAQDLETLTTIGQQFALTLANARLQEEAALHLRELALLNEACLSLTSDLSLEQVLTTVMLRTSDVIGVETGSLLMADEESGELLFRIALAGTANGILSRRVPPGKGISGWVYQHGHPLRIPDVRKDPRYYPEIDHYTGFQTRSVLCVPLQVRGQSFGVIELVNKIDGEFSEDDLHLLESVAALTATAIAQSRLHEWSTSFVLIDPLTQLPNHRFLAQALEREAARCRRYGRGCSLLLLGVDRRLHLPDARWRDLATLLKKALRQSDLLARNHDGSFAAVLPETGAEGMRTLANRLREELRRSALQGPAGEDLAEQIRFGVSSFPGDMEDPNTLLETAEAVLAQAWQEEPQQG